MVSGAMPASADAAEAAQALRSLTRESDDYAIIYIEENLAQQLGHDAMLRISPIRR